MLYYMCRLEIDEMSVGCDHTFVEWMDASKQSVYCINSMVHVCRHFPPDVCPCMQKTHKRQQHPRQQHQRPNAMPVRMRDNWRKIAGKMENIYKNELL